MRNSTLKKGEKYTTGKMTGKIIAIIMCAAACYAQLPMDCGEVETCFRREPICQEPIFSARPYFRAEPTFRCRDEFEPELIQQRVDGRTFPIVLASPPPEVNTCPQVVQAPPIVTPIRERPVIRLPHPPIPQERIVSHKCLCTKTVIKPQIIQRVITVPRIQRYLRRGYRPIVENVAYTANARGCDNFEPVIAERGAVLPIQLSQVSSIC